MVRVNISRRRFNRRQKEINFAGICLTIFVVFQLCASINGENENCLRCQDFNRENKKEKPCAENYVECGECISGYIEDSSDDSSNLPICFALEILESPAENISKNASEEVYLICKFNADINCQWTKNQKSVNIASNANYIWSNSDGESKNGVKTDDCSINIKRLTNDDVGEWTCSNVADSDVNSVKSKASYVSIKSKIKKRPNKEYDVSSGQLLTIPCQFDSEVKCNWMKNGNLIASTPNYNFAFKTLSSDCSITIKSINLDEDLGEWKCSKPGDSFSDAVETKTILQSSTKHKNFQSLPKSGIKNENPTIFYQNVNVSTSILQYSQNVDSNELMLLHCRGISVHSARIWWLLHRSIEYPGKILAKNDVYVDKALSEAIERLLEIGTEVELWCLWEDETRQTQSTMVTIINDVEPQQIRENALTAGIDSNMLIGLIIFVIILMVMIFVAMGFLGYYFWRRRANKRNTYSQEKLIKIQN